MGDNKKYSGTKKERRATQLQEFRSTFIRLREKLRLDEMGEITGILASNLSAYGTGAKNPSETTIKLFYSKLKSHIDKLPKPNKIRMQIEEARADYKGAQKNKNIHNDLVELLTANYERLWADTQRKDQAFNKIMETNNKLTNINTALADNTNLLADTNAKLAEINARLVDKLLADSGNT